MDRPIINLPLSHRHISRSRPWGLTIKRLLDVIGAIVGIIVISPIAGIIALAIRLNSPGPILYQQVRVGKEGRLFKMLKFRTMFENGSGLLEAEFDKQPELRARFLNYQKIKADPRLTYIGRIIRRTSLDELPQLWNVLIGEMSLVGPRPFLPEQRALYGASFAYYIQALPGITGLWQVSGRNSLTFRERVLLDEEYIKGWSTRLDFSILLRTIVVVIRGEGAY